MIISGKLKEASQNSSYSATLPGEKQGDKLLKHFNTVILLFIMIVAFFSPLFRGLYFYSEWLYISLTSLIILLFWLLLLILKKEKLFVLVPADYAAILFLLFYLLSIPSAVLVVDSWQEMLKVANCLFLYLLIRKLLFNTGAHSKYIQIILDTAVISGLVVSLVGISAAAGVFEFGSLLDGVRINSTFQYHNAAATYLSATFIITLGMISLQKEWLSRLFYLVIGLILLVTILFTYSRGAWLALAAAAGLFSILCAPGYRLKNVLYLTLITVVSFYGITLLEPHFTANTGYSAFIPLSVMILFVSVASILIEHIFMKFRFSGQITVIVLILFIILIIAAPQPGGAHNNQSPVLPSTIELSATEHPVQQRISEISLDTFTAKERFIYYRTALKIFRDYPLIGAGGGAWKELYLSYLTEEHPNFVYTTEVHSHYLKILIEAGALGLLAYLAVWFFFTLGFIRFRFFRAVKAEEKQLATTIFAAALMIGLHSAIELSLSFGAIAILLWILFAIGNTLTSDNFTAHSE